MWKNRLRHKFFNKGWRLSGDQRTGCASPPRRIFAKQTFCRHNSLTTTPPGDANQGAFAMGSILREVSVLLSGMLCGASFMVIGVALIRAFG